MKWKKYYSLPALLRAGNKAARHCPVISFDLFDTLLIRRIHDPDMVKLPVARYISELARHEGVVCPWYRVQEIRDTVEQEHRQRTGEQWPDHEACYPRFMGETLERIFGSRLDGRLLDEVTTFELGMEQRMLVPRVQLIAWLCDLKKQGKRIFVLSDVYLPAGHLEELIRVAGFLDQVEAVVSSADSFQAKASGLGYDFAADRFGLEPAGWLHIGDNPISDGLRPAQKGIRALVIRDAREKHRKALIKRYVNYSHGKPFWRGRAVQQLMLPLEAENQGGCSPLYTYGYNVLAPLLGAFIQGIAEQCLTNGLNRLYFFSREGWLLEKIWNVVAPVVFPLADLPQVSYLYVSRMALAGASCAHQGLTRTNADIVFLPAGNRDFRDVCRIFSLDPDPLRSLLAHHQLALDTPLNPGYTGFEPQKRLYFYGLLDDPEFQEEIRCQCAAAGHALESYLEQEDFFAHRSVALVDIGWLGTIQRFLFDAIKHRSDVPSCQGFLLAATRGIEYPTTLNNRIDGILYDRNRFDLAGSSILHVRDLFEEACRAPHPTLNGYRLDDSGQCRLIFRDRQDAAGRAEEVQNRYYQPMQKGILDGVARYASAVQLLGHSTADLKPWLNYLMVSRFAFPKTREVEEVSYRHHLDDFHGGHTPDQGGKTMLDLWQYSAGQLRRSPFLRLRFFLSSIRQRLKE